jgi:hypothetical protein
MNVRNASGTISKLDQLAIFAQLQNVPHSSSALLPILQLAHHIVKVREDAANLHGELAMCVPQIISIAFSSSINHDAQALALDFIAHISSDGMRRVRTNGGRESRQILTLSFRPARVYSCGSGHHTPSHPTVRPSPLQVTHQFAHPCSPNHGYPAQRLLRKSFLLCYLVL